MPCVGRRSESIQAFATPLPVYRRLTFCWLFEPERDQRRLDVHYRSEFQGRAQYPGPARSMSYCEFLAFTKSPAWLTKIIRRIKNATAILVECHTCGSEPRIVITSGLMIITTRLLGNFSMRHPLRTLSSYF